MKNKESIIIGNFQTGDGRKESVQESLVKMSSIAAEMKNIGPIISNGKGSFIIRHKNGFETAFSVVEYGNKKDAKYQINITSNEYALPAQYYQSVFDVLAGTVTKKGHGFDLKGLVVTDKRLSTESLLPVPPQLRDEHHTDALRITSQKGYDNENVSLIQTTYNKGNEKTDFALDSIREELKNIGDLTNVERAIYVSHLVRERNAEMER